MNHSSAVQLNLSHIRSDYHIHTSFSADSSAPMDAQIQAAIDAGLESICFTEHVDLDSPFRNVPEDDPESDFRIDYEQYLQTYLEKKAEYGGRIRLLFGVELGLNTAYEQELLDYVSSHPDFDFIIGSTHSARNGMDPYYADFFEPDSVSAAEQYASRSAEHICTDSSDGFDPYRCYFEAALDNVRTFCRQNLFDTYGHLDYILRCGPLCADGSCPERTSTFFYEKYSDLIDPLLQELIQRSKALEVNTSSLKKGFPETNPGKAVLCRYYELGGRLITVGSDAHVPGAVAYGFDRAAALLKECGFDRYVTYEQRRPQWHKL